MAQAEIARYTEVVTLKLTEDEACYVLSCLGRSSQHSVMGTPMSVSSVHMVLVDELTGAGVKRLDRFTSGVHNFLLGQYRGWLHADMESEGS